AIRLFVIQPAIIIRTHRHLISSGISALRPTCAPKRVSQEHENGKRSRTVNGLERSDRNQRPLSQTPRLAALFLRIPAFYLWIQQTAGPGVHRSSGNRATAGRVPPRLSARLVLLQLFPFLSGHSRTDPTCRRRTASLP